MPEADDQEAKNYHVDVPQRNPVVPLKGSGNYDWGMTNRLARGWGLESGKTVMLAIDHGYFQGPTTGLERIDVNILPLMPYVDAVFCTRGVLRSLFPAWSHTPVWLRASGGPSILKELSDEEIAVDIEDALRLGVCGVGVQVYVGGPMETKTIHNMTRLIDAGLRYGVPVLGVTAVGRELTRDARYLGLATRMLAELGAQVVKTYYCEQDFEHVTSACPVPIVMAGGKKLPEIDALEMAYRAVQQGASGVDMGRNIFQSDSPVAMLQAVRKCVHEGMPPRQALEFYETTKRELGLKA
ncbi:MAG: 3-hydroxy-5-phosphonooxypentane-2,4-dione thiolase [Candidatus Limnocylindrales bacterium]